uniref:Uncharacterized protein n=1 Tax=Sinocyclocheilus anshuiensis TaxID=1608454 RepID=A0A671PS88_9TELE
MSFESVPSKSEVMGWNSGNLADYLKNVIKCTVMLKLSKTDVIHKKEIEMMYYTKKLYSCVFISNPELFSYLRLKHAAVSVPLTQYRAVVLNPWPVTNSNAAHHAEHNKKKKTFSFTIHFSFYINLKMY